MFSSYVRRSKLLSIIVVAVVLSMVVMPARAEKPLPQDLIRQVGFDQRLGESIPLDLTFTDSTGQQVKLGDYFGQKPVILAMGYYECPMLCSLVRNGLYESLKKLDFTVGKEFQVVFVSIDPTETPEEAETKRQVSVMNYDRGISGNGWNFLVGDDVDIHRLAEAIGFRYTYDAKLEQYVHPSGIVVLTPQGQLSRYFYGIEYPSQDLRLGLVEAADNQIGSAVDQLLLLCYHYDPATGEYTLFIMNIIRMLGLLTVTIIGGGLFFMLRRDHGKTPTPKLGED